MASFSCPHLVGDDCQRVRGKCDPGTHGCILRGKVRFADPEKAPTPEDIERARRRVEKRRHDDG